MPQCPSCNRQFSDSDVQCPVCGHPGDEALESEDRQRLVRIARFTNAAEAGYFAHELAVHHAISTKIIAEENFDALNGYWSTRYALAVTEIVADTARTALKEFVEQLEADEFDDIDDDFNPIAGADPSSDVNFRTLGYDRTPEFNDELSETRDLMMEESGVNWIPVVLTLAAGSVAFWAARRIHEQPQPAVLAAPAGPHTEDLWDFLAHEETPWVQELHNGVGMRELDFDPQHQLFIIREDRDGDGLFETQLNFPRKPLRP